MKKTIVVILGDPNLPHSIMRDKKFGEFDAEAVSKLKEALNKLEDYDFIYLDNHENLKVDLIKYAQAHLFLNLCDEGLYNQPFWEAAVVEILKDLALPFSGSDYQCLQTCHDKQEVLKIAEEHKIPVPKRSGSLYEIGFPVILKPNLADGSLGITRDCYVESPDELEEMKRKMELQFERKYHIEEFLPGADLSVGIIGNLENLLVLPINEDDYSMLDSALPKICGFEAKWDEKSAYWNQIVSQKANLPIEIEKQVIHWSRFMFNWLCCYDYARLDWRLDKNGQPKLLEINPNPGWCWDGHLAKMAGYAGMSYSQMLLAIINAAEMRLKL